MEKGFLRCTFPVDFANDSSSEHMFRMMIEVSLLAQISPFSLLEAENPESMSRVADAKVISFLLRAWFCISGFDDENRFKNRWKRVALNLGLFGFSIGKAAVDIFWLLDPQW